MAKTICTSHSVCMCSMITVWGGIRERNQARLRERAVICGLATIVVDKEFKEQYKH